MPIYSYKCRDCGNRFDTLKRGDSSPCTCGETAIRVWSTINIDAKSARHQGRFDPQVGAYVESERQFNNLLRQGQDAQEEKLGMPVKLEKVDARDHEALAELHGHSTEQREHDLEGTRKAEFDKKSA